MKKYVLIAFGIIFASNFVQAQDSVVVVIELTESKEKDPINNANGTFSYDGQKKLLSSKMGRFVFKTTVGTNVNANITHNAYESIYKTLKISKNYNYDSIFFNYEMNLNIKIQDIVGVDVVAPGIPKIIYKSKRLHVQDFEVLEDGRLVLLTYPKQLKKGSELLLYDGSKVLNTFSVPGVATDLVRDYRGNPHVVCKENVFGIHVNGNKIGISTLEKEYFFTYVAPIVDTNTSKMYFTTFRWDYPAFDYYVYDQLDSTYQKIMGVEDELMMELYRSEYKWVDVRTKLWAKNLEIQTGKDAERWVGEKYFTRSIYYEELYAPLFHRNDSLFVFDYYKDKLYTYGANAEILDSTSLLHHYQPRKTGWKKHLIQDRTTGEIYALYDRAGYSYLGWIDAKTGEVKQQVKLSKRYAEHIKIDGNYVYYVFREFESIDKKQLWKERLPYEFGPGFVALPTEGRAIESRN